MLYARLICMYVCIIVIIDIVYGLIIFLMMCYAIVHFQRNVWYTTNVMTNLCFSFRALSYCNLFHLYFVEIDVSIFWWHQDTSSSVHHYYTHSYPMVIPYVLPTILGMLLFFERIQGWKIGRQVFGILWDEMWHIHRIGNASIHWTITEFELVAFDSVLKTSPLYIRKSMPVITCHHIPFQLLLYRW